MKQTVTISTRGWVILALIGLGFLCAVAFVLFVQVANELHR